MSDLVGDKAFGPAMGLDRPRRRGQKHQQSKGSLGGSLGR